MIGFNAFSFFISFYEKNCFLAATFLVITFNWGIIMAWAAIHNSISFEIVLLYLSAIFWTLGYDTIYGAQDMSDDEIIGLKSTSIKFKKNIKLFVSMSYLVTSMIIIYLFIENIIISFFFVLLFILSLLFQILKFNKNKPLSCLESFKINNLSGLFLFLGIYLNNY